MIDKSKKRIELVNISKSFEVDHKTKNNALFHIINFFKRNNIKKEVVVAKNISLEVFAGEILGVIGKNGSGKSTLLRLIAQIYQIDSGLIKTDGKIVYLSGYGQGLIPKLTMKENIYLLSSVLGLKQKDIRKKINQIVYFSGLENSLDTKTYQFSTGMVSRLLFSIMIHCVKHQNPEILLIDEAFSAGGDLEFIDRATKKMEELITGGASVVLVSHDLNIIEKYCSRTILLDSGEIRMAGNTKTVLEFYKNA